MTSQARRPNQEAATRAEDPWRRVRLGGVLLLLGAFLAMAWPHHPQTGWNVNTRLALIFAVVERGTFTIDAYHDTPPYATGDKALFRGHHYSDKIFGASLLAFPVYAIAYHLNGGPVEFQRAAYLMKGSAVALPGAFACLFFWLILVKTGTPPRRAIVLTALSLAGTMWLGYGTIFFPFMAGLAALLGAILLVFYPPAGRLTKANCLGMGALLGYALLCELTFGLVVAGIGTIWLLRLIDQVGIAGFRAFAEMRGERSRWPELVLLSVLFWVGVLLPLSLYFVYSWHIFGALTIPYHYEVDPLFREGMAQGLMGVTTPKASVFYFITVHPYRGIFLWSPLLIAGLVGCVIATRQYGKRLMLGWLGIWCLAAYLYFNSAYYMWWGGWAMGPRLMIPMIPFVLLGLGELARTDKVAAFVGRPRVAAGTWYGTIVLGVAGVLLCGPLSLTDPQVPQGNQTDALLEPSFYSRYAVPQVQYLRVFYRGDVTLWPWHRLEGYIGTDNRVSNVLSIAVYLLLCGGLFFAAWWLSPVRLPGIDRHDFPFRTMDGSLAPPPLDQAKAGGPK